MTPEAMLKELQLSKELGLYKFFNMIIAAISFALSVLNHIYFFNPYFHLIISLATIGLSSCILAPIFLAYKNKKEMKKILAVLKEEEENIKFLNFEGGAPG